MKRVLAFLIFISLAATGMAQKRAPEIGYVYPAGCQQGQEVTVQIGGQYLAGAQGVIVDAEGVEFEILEYKRPLSGKARNEMMEKLKPVRNEIGKYLWNRKIPYQKRLEKIMEIAEEYGVEQKTVEAFLEFREKQQDPKRQPNRQLEETVMVRVRVAHDAPPGPKELRLQTRRGISNPVRFYVGNTPEYNEQEPNEETPTLTLNTGELPAVINGQIMPGDVDVHAFEARKWTKLVARVQAREIKPYLADAVPGWFQATLTLTDAEGNELTTVDDHAFHPDPILYYVIPEDGTYRLEVKDSIYRGREDFVYRLTLGELPLVTSYFPLGLQAGTESEIQLQGVNLPQKVLKVKAPEPAALQAGEHISVRKRSLRNFPLAAPLIFDVGELPEVTETSGSSPNVTRVDLPVIVNGRIRKAGEIDSYRFHIDAGMQLLAEVMARRVGSPLDSFLRVTDAKGKRLASCDDVADPGEGILTHHADSRLMVTLPRAGEYTVSIGDIQSHGGDDYAYRLYLRPPRPDFQLRVVPSSISCRPGGEAEIVVHVIRKEGFQGPVELKLPDEYEGYRLSQQVVPADVEKLTLNIEVPKSAPAEPLSLRLAGSAMINGQTVTHSACPADDRMQAFIYRHLVPARQWLVYTMPRKGK